jgi:peptide chain release factor 2
MPEQHEINSIIKDCGTRLEALSKSLDIEGKSSRIAEIEKKMSAADFWNNQEAALALVDEMKALKSMLEPVVSASSSLSDCVELLELASAENDGDTVAEITAQILALPEEVDRIETMSLLSDPHDAEPCFFSVHTGAGGADACEWAEILLRMYRRHFERRGWKCEELSLIEGEEAGLRSVELRVQGEFAYGYLRGEIGVHRLVRISPFSGKRETSFAAVDVVPDFQQEIDIEINEDDLKIDRIHSTGKGGQHVNKTASAVRISHIPSGIVVLVQNERSQHRNKDMAMKMLKARLLRKQEAERDAKTNARNAQKMENAWGSQIRNYVMNPYTMVKDARTGHETGDIQKVLDGDIEGFSNAYLRWSVEED